MFWIYSESIGHGLHTHCVSNASFVYVNCAAQYHLNYVDASSIHRLLEIAEYPLLSDCSHDIPFAYSHRQSFIVMLFQFGKFKGHVMVLTLTHSYITCQVRT